MPLVGEIWAPVAGFDDYEVSNFGRVRSYRKPTWNSQRRTVPKIIRQFGMGRYLGVVLCRGAGEKVKRYIHRLVLESFVGTCPEGMECLHGAAGRYDNSLGNLRWGTHKENMSEIETPHSSWLEVLSTEVVRLVRSDLINRVPVKVIARKFGVSKMTVYRIKNGKTYQRD